MPPQTPMTFVSLFRQATTKTPTTATETSGSRICTSAAAAAAADFAVPLLAWLKQPREIFSSVGVVNATKPRPPAAAAPTPAFPRCTSLTRRALLGGWTGFRRPAQGWSVCLGAHSLNTTQRHTTHAAGESNAAAAAVAVFANFFHRRRPLKVRLTRCSPSLSLSLFFSLCDVKNCNWRIAPTDRPSDRGTEGPRDRARPRFGWRGGCRVQRPYDILTQTDGRTDGWTSGGWMDGCCSVVSLFSVYLQAACKACRHRILSRSSIKIVQRRHKATPATTFFQLQFANGTSFIYKAHFIVRLSVRPSLLVDIFPMACTYTVCLDPCHRCTAAS